ncbi:hypothetical protein DUNSADRAFT_4199 [Dunaliella salina]|uniref:Uncharacterized protein n=1 Tax=Dunaliella salina TaxID=3046 RepID=A0ABQ7GSH2_DUNSA|nr:hypothetical protein DUNSADRAFT_4199 [Dunaliella salina]|eukprot:KAF5837564.1 hypothetical protein DUNSADRAFT_4199 [Dunaliella salina]
MEVYQVALKLVPESRELSQKIHSQRNQINKKAKSTKLSAAVDPAGTKDGAARSAAGGKDTDSKDTVKGSKEGQPRSSSAKGSKGSSKEGHAGAPKPPPQQPQVGPSQPAQDNRGNDVVYDDLGSIEVAKFAEEFLGVLRDDIEEGTVIPTVHFLPGRKLKSSEEAEAHVRIAGAFESPDTLASLTDFLRQKGGQLQAQAVLAVVPKSDIAFPRVWDKPKWPGGEKQGIFAQLETPTLRKLWFIPTQGKKAETALAADFDRFSLLPRLLKT